MRHVLGVVQRAGAEREQRAPRPFLDFCRHFSVPPWEEGPHHALITGAIERAVIGAAQDKGENLMIFAPPQHGKSHVSSVLGPAWTLGSFPNFRVILASYGASLATEKSAEARNLLMTNGEEAFGVTVDPRSAAVSRWGLAGQRGTMVAAGVGGPITGKGGDLGICDDPVKNEKEASSALVREAVWRWWQTTFETRFKTGAAKVLIMTRWHEDDLGGRLLRERGIVEQGGEWRVLRLRAVMDTEAQVAEDPLHRQLGEVLWPARFPPAEIARRRLNLGSYYFSAMYQQEPLPEGGAMFRRGTFLYFQEVEDERGHDYVLYLRAAEGHREVRVRAEDCWSFVTNDPAFTTNRTSDWWVAEHWVVTPRIDGIRYRLLADVLRLRLEVPDQLARLEQYAREHGTRFVGVEESVGALAVIQQAERDGRFPVVRCKPDRDKQARAAPLSGRYEAGHVLHRAGAAWLSEYEEELVRFPKGTHDDQVDAAAFAELLLLVGDEDVGEIAPYSIEQISPWDMGLSERRWNE